MQGPRRGFVKTRRAGIERAIMPGCMAEDPEIRPPPMSREALLDPGRREALARAYPFLHLLTDEELARSLDAVLAGRPPGADVWLFAYGSLIWNPIIAFAERRVGKVHGWHRSFCLRADAGRGSPERPGLFLGLKPGGACRGILYRLAAAEAGHELMLIWRREMITNAYVPRWVTAATLAGPVNAIAMTVNRRHSRYVGDLEEDEAVRWIATAEGRLGRCCDYLFDTVSHLREAGAADPRLESLADAVRAFRSEG